jgi:ABC-type multidrug transport system fused ATPase/permease subunit
LEVVPTLGFLQQVFINYLWSFLFIFFYFFFYFSFKITQPLSIFPLGAQAIVMISVGVNRIRDFLILPEISNDNENFTSLPSQNIEQIKYAVVVENASYKYSDPPEIPMSDSEKEEMEKKKKGKEILDKALEERKVKIYDSALMDSSSVSSPSISPFSLKKKNILDAKESSSNQENDKENTEKSGNNNDDLDSKPTLENISFEIAEGSLTMVIGGVGSGKSSIGAALIGDITKLSGNSSVNGSIAYCPQGFFFFFFLF